jgi:tRNA (pseudouridine54-N1)-methyltransferase
MRRFIVYSESACTSPVIGDLKSAGRIDVLLHSIISALFASNLFRDDVEIHLIMMGPPTSPRHIMIRYAKGNTISKKNLKKLIEIALRRCKQGERREVHPGVFVDDYSIERLILEFKDIGVKDIFVLDGYGEHIKDIEKEKLEDGVFILGDHEGFDKSVKKFLKKNVDRLSLGPRVYFTSQAITIINYEIDNL